MNSQETNQAQYTVVARRYRPQSFGEMVGQNHIAHALSNAIKQNRVGHAYLFTGARGVGKTSSARIFAKCLNCEKGPTDQPCNECDLCASVSVGEDLDVLEIDGASNRGIDEIRQLRSNAIVRPSRSKFKIYIIDEVHMLTQQAFNALLKTLEEPPDHVKFIFCTTDPQKIPITVLSRCQRFDFSPVQTPDIIGRLQEICQNENIEADEQALAALARRAAGSMRDSQSLLEQLLSFCSERISIDDVHQLLGTADVRRITEMVDAIVDGDTATCINQVALAIESGVDAGQLANQLLGYFRDIMAIRVGAGIESLLTCSESDVDDLKKKSESIGLETILSIVQIIDQCITRMQSSMHSRTLLEVAIVRICSLDSLDMLSDLVERISSASAPDAKSKSPAKLSAAKKKPVTPVKTKSAEDVAVSAETVSSKQAIVDDNSTDGLSLPKLELSESNLDEIWHQAARSAGGMTTDMAIQTERIELEGLKIVAVCANKHVYEFCRRSDRSNVLQSAIQKITGQNCVIVFRVDKVSAEQESPKTPKLTRVQMIRQLEKHDLVKSAIDVFDAEVVEFLDSRPDQ